MLDFAVKKWDKNKDKLQEYFTSTVQSEYADDYTQLLKKIITIIFNDGDYSWEEGNQKRAFNLERLKVIDYGDYQGTLVFVFPYENYQPDVTETFYTSVYYGSCSGCDTLQGICCYDYHNLPSERQVKDYMTLALHLIQRMHQMEE